jgi:L-rhamnose-H+ transport protein
MQTEVGVILAIGGGVMLGNSMLPLNYLRRWRWENAWIVFSFVALIAMPWILALLRVPKLFAVYTNVDGTSFIMPLLFGAGWGVAQVLFGLPVSSVGIALAFSITIGLSAALGTLVPILLKRPEMLATEKGLVLLLNTFLMLAGVFCCGWAGQRREREQRASDTSGLQTFHNSGVLMATLAGILAPLLNYGLAFGSRFIIEAISQNTPASDAPYAVWPIVLAAGAIPNLTYAGSLAFSKRTWTRFRPMAGYRVRHDDGLVMDGGLLQCMARPQPC